MAVIHECGHQMSESDFGIGDAFGTLRGLLLDSIAEDMWKWFESHKQDVILKKWWFTIRVRHLRKLFEILFDNPK